MTTPTLHANPLLAPWLKTAQTMAAPWAGLFTGELARRQIEAMAEFNRRALRAWTGAWAFAPAAAASSTRDTPPEATPEPVPQQAVPLPVVPLAELAEAVPLPAAPVAHVVPETAIVPPGVAPTLPEPLAAAVKKRAKPAAPLRTATQLRKASPVVAKPSRVSAKPQRGSPGKPKGVTRH